MAFETETETIIYDKDYWNKYVSYENTQIDKSLNSIRHNLTNKYCSCLLDIGIGSGSFIKSSENKIYGFDINPYAISWLGDLFVDPYKNIFKEIEGFTLWDVLEHLPDPPKLLERLYGYVFIAMPTYSNITKITSSKHYRPREHLFYFTNKGLVEYMEHFGFKCLEMNDLESKAGREDIWSFVFHKSAFFSLV